MKKFTINLMVLVLAFLANDAVAKVIRVDNNEGASADYVKLQDAINNAEAGDTIYVVGSPNWYDTNTSNRAVEIRLNKQLTIIGPGFLLGENENTQVSKETAKVYQMNIGEGADGATITGLDFNESTNSSIVINAERFDGSNGTSGPQNVTVKRNKIYVVYIVDGDNTLLTQNFLNSRTYPVYLYREASNTIISNNIIFTTSTISIYGRDNVALTNTIISNNVLSHRLYTINGATVQNNIFITGGLYDSDNNNLKNNLFTTTEDAVVQENSTGNSLVDNIFSAVQANIFVVPDPSTDNEYRLASDSPAVGQGVNGEDLGAFGGITPYRLSGQPSIPAIYDLSTTGVGTPSDGMQVQIKVKANN
jgi:hypothetical protein